MSWLNSPYESFVTFWLRWYTVLDNPGQGHLSYDRPLHGPQSVAFHNTPRNDRLLLIHVWKHVRIADISVILAFIVIYNWYPVLGQLELIITAKLSYVYINILWRLSTFRVDINILLWLYSNQANLFKTVFKKCLPYVSDYI